MNYLARLGGASTPAREVFTRAELIEKFSLIASHSGAPPATIRTKLFWLEGPSGGRACRWSARVAGVIPFLVRRGWSRAGPRSDRSSGDTGGGRARTGRPYQGCSPNILTARRYFFTKTVTLRPGPVEDALRKEEVRRCSGAEPVLLQRSSRKTCDPWKKGSYDFATKARQPDGTGRSIRSRVGDDRTRGRGPGRIELPVGILVERPVPRRNRGGPGDALRRAKSPEVEPRARHRGADRITEVMGPGGWLRSTAQGAPTGLTARRPGMRPRVTLREQSARALATRAWPVLRQLPYL